MSEAAEPSISDLRKMMDGPDTQAEEPAIAETVEAAPATGEAEQPGESEPAPDSEPANSQERDEQGKFIKAAETTEEAELPRGAQKAIDKQVRARREAERESDELRAENRRLRETREATPSAVNTPPKPEPVAAASKPKPVLVVPKIEDFDYDTEKHEAAKTEAIAQHADELTDWKLDQREAARQATAKTESQQSAAQIRAGRVSAIIDKGREEFDDFNEVVLDGKAVISEAMLDVIIENPALGPKVAHWLGSNREEAARIAKLPAAMQGVELGKIEAKLTPAPKSTATPEKKVKAALPKPPIVVGAGGTPADVDLDTCSMRAFTREVDKILYPAKR